MNRIRIPKPSRRGAILLSLGLLAALAVIVTACSSEMIVETVEVVIAGTPAIIQVTAPVEEGAPYKQATQAAFAAEEKAGDGGDTTPRLDGTPVARMIIRHGEIEIVVMDTRQGRHSIQAMVDRWASQGAYVVQSQESGYSQEYPPVVTISIRVPVAKFDEAMAAIAEMSVEIVNRYESASDVTE